MAEQHANSRVVILGGTAGIGWETAARFVEEGARVVLLGRNDGRGEAACERIRQRVPMGDIGFVRVDGADPMQALQAADAALGVLGGLDVLMCASGPGTLPALLHEIPITSFADRLGEIVLPPLHVTQAFLPYLRAQGSGSVILVASDAAKVATPGESIIGAGMAAICMFARTAAMECKREGVRINVLTPSLVADTPGAALIETDPFSAKLFAKAAKLAQLGVATPSDLAELALFLAGSGSARMTGQVISVNGGISVA